MQNNTLFKDGFSVIGAVCGYYNDENGTQYTDKPKYFYCDITGDFRELSPALACYIARKLKEDNKNGYKLIDLLNRGRNNE